MVKARLRKAEKDHLYEKLTRIVGEKIDELTSESREDRWALGELAEALNVHQTRLTEIKDFDKYKKKIPESILATFIGEGFISMEEITQKANFSDKEQEHFNSYEYYQNTRLKKLIEKVASLGLNPEEILEQKIKETEKNK